MSFEPSIHSYDPSIGVEDYITMACTTCWAVDMPSQDDKSRDAFITVRTLGAARVEVMSGRETIVWQVIKHSDPNDIKPSSSLALKT
ncbi:hypothetical protein PILCRDRAFT_814643 [Piloderma croceum F 1598]|uniref:Uncharacterized protein n=1 Tax=Piloderma croceum (strain F 1598) TaxID=765440 RepID=A0A0C3G839_PILCF|nr:hypothetical protein PILCRDRAFT_814643 [Piloderma croceum F 1598]